ncbi:DUF742 domain-containing protein [Amycolatopsis magusensis]|uniref:DUF742 domain-containing protein n=1 Tax=Amycolatopsis magusensis TaxID=882444 RepID=A0ABS4PJP6_9PSEU|nr:DUF742 domain-containing protein [Amycolatopsis magusensis]MBP2179063.1 hypothetical protein [Amycolatopsis magusensis]MDI5978096.1 DUF742 domain-containing protein [Amycolatopsis magusensis]
MGTPGNFGLDPQPVSADWDALHAGSEREALDSPSRFDIAKYTTGRFSLPVSPPPPPPEPEAPSWPSHEPDPEPAPMRAMAPVRPAARPPAPVWPAGRASRSLVRPYARTGGRTHSAHDLALEALISTTDQGRAQNAALPTEYRLICELCYDTHSIAEIAAYLRLPLGVVKVFVGDLADAGLVLIHQSSLIQGDPSAREFMERVLQGLRDL